MTRARSIDKLHRDKREGRHWSCKKCKTKWKYDYPFDYCIKCDDDSLNLNKESKK